MRLLTVVSFGFGFELLILVEFIMYFSNNCM